MSTKMFKVILFIFLILVLLPVYLFAASGQTAFQLLSGESGSDSRWGSGWVDLDVPTDFNKGDKLQLTLGGSAKKVKIRFLPKGSSSDSRAGIMNKIVTIPKNRVVEVTLKTNRKNIVQISVHGGPNPWGKYPLGADNGSATLDSISVSYSGRIER